MVLTEKDAAIAYAKAWNKLECSDFLKLLDDNAHYASQWVLDELENKEAIAEYLIGKMQTVRESGSQVHAELGKARSGFGAGRDCVIMAQDRKDKIMAVVLFEVNDNRIRRYGLCMPELLNAEGTGIYPI